MNKKMLILSIFVGAALVGYTTGNVVAQEVKIGDTSGSPFISFQDLNSTGMYEIRLNDGTGQFQIWDMTNNRSVFLVEPTGKMAVGDGADANQIFTVSCATGKCNIQTRAANGTAQNTVTSLAGDGNAIFRLNDKITDFGDVKFDIQTRQDGTVCMGSTSTDACMLIFDIKGSNPGQVRQTDGTCIANC